MGIDRTLRGAREQLEAGLDAGIECPCCGQWAKRYRRKLNRIQARWLIWLVGEAGVERQWVEIHDPAVIARRRRAGLADGPTGGEYGKLAHWRLVEQMANGDERKRTSATWRPTDRGVLFVFGRLQVAAHGTLYNNEVVEWSSEAVGIEEALGVEFNYGELMRSAGLSDERLPVDQISLF